MTVIWSAAIVVFLIIEGVTAGLSSIWFAIGAAAALVSTLIGAPIWLQLVCFVLISGAAIYFTRPLVKKYINSKTVATNADRLIGMEGIVTERIDNLAAGGAVSVDGKIWSARAAGDETFEEGEHVNVLEIRGVKLIVGDKCLGMLEAVGEVFPDAKYQRCVVHFYRNIFSVVPKSKVKYVAKMLKAIHAQENKEAARKKADAVVEELRSMKLKEAAKKVCDSFEETLTYMSFPSEHWTKIRTNNVIERMNREIRRRTRVVGTFPDGNSALMLVCARLRHVAGTQWGSKKYMSMKHLEMQEEIAS